MDATHFPFRMSDFMDKQSQDIKDLMSDVKILKVRIDQQKELRNPKVAKVND